jgi:hypothetical protein
MTNKIAVLAVLIGSLSGFGSAHAQPGSRLCGWMAPLPAQAAGKPSPGNIGLLYEIRTKDASDSKQCDQATSKFADAIKADPTLKSMTWSKVHKSTCEAVGANFKSTTHPNNDMCDYMEAKHPYQVQKTMTSATTSSSAYKKL